MYFRKLGIVATLVLITAACSKQAIIKTSNDKEQTGLIGSWQWVQSDGGLSYHVLTPASTGKQMALKLTDSTYAFYTNNALTAQGTYQMETRACIHDHTQKPFLNFSTGNGFMIEAQRHDSLFLSDENYDGMGSVYVRAANEIK